MPPDTVEAADGGSEDRGSGRPCCHCSWCSFNRPVCTWMSQEVSKRLGSGLQPQYNPFITIGYNPFTNRIITSWDILVVPLYDFLPMMWRWLISEATVLDMIPVQFSVISPPDNDRHWEGMCFPPKYTSESLTTKIYDWWSWSTMYMIIMNDKVSTVHALDSQCIGS